MSANSEHRANNKKIKLRGTRPSGVVGEMNPEAMLEALREAREAHTIEDDERSWRELDRMLREDPV